MGRRSRPRGYVKPTTRRRTGGPPTRGSAASEAEPELVLPEGVVIPKGAVIPRRLAILESMRLDKFLQVSQLVRRRAFAAGLCRVGRVRKNGQLTKPSAPVVTGDVIEIHHRSRDLAVKVNLLAEWWPAGRETLMYVVLHDVRRPEYLDGDIDPDAFHDF